MSNMMPKASVSILSVFGNWPSGTVCEITAPTT